MKQCVVEKYCSHKYQEEIKTKRLFIENGGMKKSSVR